MTTEDGVLLRENAVHTHPPSQVQAQVDRVVSTMRKRAQEEVAPIRAIYRQEVQKLAQPRGVSTITCRQFGGRSRIFWYARGIPK